MREIVQLHCFVALHALRAAGLAVYNCGRVECADSINTARRKLASQ